MVRAACRTLEKVWSRKLLPEPCLDSDWLTSEAARRERGEPAPGCWEQALRLMTDDLAGPARLNPLGRTIAHALILQTLRQRIRAAALWRAKPAIIDTPIRAPVIVLGQMRSGTTFLHRLLACDGKFAHTKLHESVQPLPRSRPAAVAATAMTQNFLSLCNPMLRRIHPTSALAPDEEFGLHAFSFHGAMFEAQWDLPGFARWSESRNLTPVYEEFKRLLQTLRWRRGDLARIQLLKAPQFMQDLPAVIAAFPDARFVRITRDRSKVVASSASLVWQQRRIQSDDANSVRVGAEWKRKTALRELCAAEAFKARPSVPLLDLDYDSIQEDWLGEIHAVYDFLGLHLGRPVIRRMARLTARRAHLGHHYSRRQFGLS